MPLIIFGALSCCGSVSAMMIGRVTPMSRIVGSILKLMLAVCTLGMCHDLKSTVIDIPAAAPIFGEYAQQKFDVALISGTPFSLVTS